MTQQNHSYKSEIHPWTTFRVFQRNQSRPILAGSTCSDVHYSFRPKIASLLKAQGIYGYFTASCGVLWCNYPQRRLRKQYPDKRERQDTFVHQSLFGLDMHVSHMIWSAQLPLALVMHYACLVQSKVPSNDLNVSDVVENWRNNLSGTHDFQFGNHTRATHVFSFKATVLTLLYFL